MSLLLRLKEKNAHTVFGAIGAELRKDGVELIAGTPWLTPLMAGSTDGAARTRPSRRSAARRVAISVTES